MWRFKHPISIALILAALASVAWAGLESGTYVSDLVSTNPTATDVQSQGDDHLRLLKATLQSTFPNADKAFYFPDGVAKTANYTVLTTDLQNFYTADTSGGSVTFTLPSLTSSDDGAFFVFHKISASNSMIIAPPSGNINGSASLTYTQNYSSVLVWWGGSAYYALVWPNLQSAPESLTALTALDVADTIPVYDTSATADKQITVTNFFKVITGLTAETSPAVDDELALYDLSATTGDKITLANLWKVVNGLTEETAPVAGDFIPLYDTSGSTTDKVDFKYISPFSSQLYNVRDVKAAGTAGGTATSGAWRDRTLQTEVTTEITGASLASNVITLPAGTYYVDGYTSFGGNGSGVNEFQSRLRNVTDSTTTIVGSSGYMDGSDGSEERSHFRGRFTIAAEKTFKVQYQVGNTIATIGLGNAAGFDESNTYTDVQIWKVK